MFLKRRAALTIPLNEQAIPTIDRKIFNIKDLVKNIPIPYGMRAIVLTPEKSYVPLVASLAIAGFPSPADDYLDRPLDFNELLIENPAATFAVRIGGESMTGAGLFPGDIAVVNRARKVINGNIVLALVDGEFTLKRYKSRAGKIKLLAENPKFTDIIISDETILEIWGVVTHSIRIL
jgi:DNA polymerase V